MTRAQLVESQSHEPQAVQINTGAMGARVAILVAFAAVLPLLATACGGSDRSVAASELEARFKSELRSEFGSSARGVQVECTEGDAPAWWQSRPGEQVLGCTVTDPDCHPKSRRWNLCVDDLGEWSGKAWMGCRFHDPDPMGNDVTCSWIHESAFNDGARGGFSFDAPAP